MRVSSTMAFESGVASMNRQQADLLKIQQQMSSGLRVTTASDDPSAAARAVVLNGSAARNTQFLSNQESARASLSLMETALGQFSDAHAEIRSLLIQAGNAVLSAQDRSGIAAELRAQADYLLSLANTRDADGAYIFSGYQQELEPFRKMPDGVVFQGDQGHRELYIADSRSLPVSVSGATLFERLSTGNGVFETAAHPENTGTGLIDIGQVFNAVQIDGHSYRLEFKLNAGAVRYDVIDATLGATISSDNAYVPGGEIVVGGMSFQITGNPAAGDRFTLAPDSSRNLMNALNDIADLLNRTTGSASDRVRLQMGLARAVRAVDSSLDGVLLARGAAGAGLRELDLQQALSEARDLAYQAGLSDLRDLDYAKAISDLTQRQAVSEATQKAFVTITGRSLFDLL